eukprot:49348-Alexandrium_andersonii.AAC.1
MNRGATRPNPEGSTTAPNCRRRPKTRLRPQGPPRPQTRTGARGGWEWRPQTRTHLPPGGIRAR